MAAHQAPPSLGSSRQEHWSGFLLGGIGGKRRRGRQRMRWLDGITNSMDVNLSATLPPESSQGLSRSRSFLRDSFVTASPASARGWLPPPAPIHGGFSCAGSAQLCRQRGLSGDSTRPAGAGAGQRDPLVHSLSCGVPARGWGAGWSWPLASRPCGRARVYLPATCGSPQPSDRSPGPIPEGQSGSCVGPGTRF